MKQPGAGTEIRQDGLNGLGTMSVGVPGQHTVVVLWVLRRHDEAEGSRPRSARHSDGEVRELARTVPALREAVSRLGRRPHISNVKAKAVLSWAPRPVGETILDTAQSLITQTLV